MMLPAIWHIQGLGSQRRDSHRLVFVVAAEQQHHSSYGVTKLGVLWEHDIYWIESGPQEHRVTVFATEEERANWYLQQEFEKENE